MAVVIGFGVVWVDGEGLREVGQSFVEQAELLIGYSRL